MTDRVGLKTQPEKKVLQSDFDGVCRYMPVRKWDTLYQTLIEALENHNDVLPVMNLVLFEDAIMHM